jgi:hypothetical protein
VGNAESMIEMKLGTSFRGLTTVTIIPTTRTKPKFVSRPVQVGFVADKLAPEWSFLEYFDSLIHIFPPQLHSYV